MRLRHALQELKISGIPTTIPLHIALANDEDVSNGTFDTKFLETWLETKFTTANNQIEEIA
jgi:acetyl-CoA carboxylase biotin carboxylase subunit